MIKNSKNLAFGLMGCGFFMIFTGCVSSFVIGLRQDQIAVRARIEDVTNTFEEFSTVVSLYEENRDKLYGKVLSNLYYDSMYANDKSVKERIANYEAIVDEVVSQKDKLEYLCNDVYYPDTSTNSKCLNYKLIYEQVNNYFVSDINFYNKSIEEYNKYVTASGNNLILKKYNIKKDFIDFNKDGSFDGKEE